MRTVVLCGSRRYKEEILKFSQHLKKRGVVVLEPILNTNSKITDLSGDLRRYAFLGLTLHHLELIRKADVVFVYNKDGYVGNSTTLELGAAVILGKLVFALEHDSQEPCREVLFDGVVNSASHLVKLLK